MKYTEHNVFESDQYKPIEGNAEYSSIRPKVVQLMNLIQELQSPMDNLDQFISRAMDLRYIRCRGMVKENGCQNELYIGYFDSFNETKLRETLKEHGWSESTWEDYGYVFSTCPLHNSRDHKS